jgi:D-methionine transport system ATP-binding protein
MVNHQLDLAQLFCQRVLQLQAGLLINDQPSISFDWESLDQSLRASAVEDEW